MRGAIGAGHRLTAEAGAAVLAEGGNAVDACIAAAFASWVVESPLTGPGAGGFMLVHRATDSSSRVLDFFVATPGLGRGRRDHARMEHVEVDFTPESSQAFRIGAASCAVPGALAGLEQAHRSYGSLAWERLVEPALALARDGFELTPPQAYLHAILDLILRHTDEGRRVYGRNGERLVAGDTSPRPRRHLGQRWRGLYGTYALSGSYQPMALRSRACARANSSCHGQADAMAILIRRTLTRTRAPIFSSFSRMVPQVASANWRVCQADAAQGAEQHIGHRGEPQAELVGAHGRGRGAVGEQVELALLDAVLHLAARAVDLLVEMPRAGLGCA